jgi:hypothetical protein
VSLTAPRAGSCLLAAIAVAFVAALPLMEPASADAALKTAAGGGTTSGGFTTVVSYADKIASYLTAFAVPAAVLAAIVVGFMFMSGNPSATTWAGRLAIGFIIVVGAKGIAS